MFPRIGAPGTNPAVPLTRLRPGERWVMSLTNEWKEEDGEISLCERGAGGVSVPRWFLPRNHISACTRALLRCHPLSIIKGDKSHSGGVTTASLWCCSVAAVHVSVIPTCQLHLYRGSSTNRTGAWTDGEWIRSRGDWYRLAPILIIDLWSGVGFDHSLLIQFQYPLWILIPFYDFAAVNTKGCHCYKTFISSISRFDSLWSRVGPV